MRQVRLAVFGDVHGKQDAMYETALRWQDTNKSSIDAILQVGDFETIRREDDFRYYFAPERYHHISDIAAYCEGVKKAPFFTVFIGGNHEAWGVLKDHSDGGFICPNIYYLGRAGVIDVKGIKVGGLTGIYGKTEYGVPLPEEPCYEWQYYREDAVEKLRNAEKVDVLLLHSWIKPYQSLEIVHESDIPESMKQSRAYTPTHGLVRKLQPRYVFMGHMHHPYIEARMGPSEIIGLREFTDGSDPNSFKIVEVTI